MAPTLRGLTIGVAGGALFWLLQIPAPWLAGSMIAAVAAVLSGIRIALPDHLRTASFILLGIQTGASVDQQTLARAAQWPLSLALLGFSVIAVTWACLIFYRSRGWDVATALFASLPGALGLVVLLASSSRADMRRVTIAQSIRLFLLIAALPPLITAISPAEPPAVNGSIQSGSELLLLVVAATAAGLGLDRLRVPAGLILGPTLVAAALELGGFVHGSAPMLLLMPANVILGVLVAARFESYSLADLAAALREGLGGFAVALSIAGACAGLASLAAQLPFALTLLAFAPGGLDAMTLLAFALNLDPAYVGAHQIARYVGLALTLPWLAGLIVRRLERTSG